MDATPRAVARAEPDTGATRDGAILSSTVGMPPGSVHLEPTSGPGIVGRDVPGSVRQPPDDTQQLHEETLETRASEGPGGGAPASADLRNTEPRAGRSERLSALDAVFLAIEDERDLMHIGLSTLLEKGPLCTKDGAVDVDRIRKYVRSSLRSLPKFRKKLTRVPLLRHPVLVDDDRFDLDFHVRFLQLERGTEGEFQELVGRIYSEALDRQHPLWELWVIDGLPNDELAIVMKTHHCLVDGVAGIAVLTSLLSASPDVTFDSDARWDVEPPPSPRDLLHGELAHLGGSLREALRGIGPGFRERVRAFASGLGPLVSSMLHPVSRSSLNPGHVGASRSFAWEEIDLSRVKAVKNAASVKLNDVVLATAAGAMRTFLRRRGEDPTTMMFRAVCPVSTHELGSQAVENDVSFLIVPLPLWEPDPKRRLELVSSTMLEAKASGEVEALSLIERLADMMSFGVVSAAMRAVPHLRAYNVIITNVPGPDIPFYFLGARVRAAYPLVPLYGNNTLGIALLSFGGKLFWGFNADRDQVPDLSHLVKDVRDAFDELEAAVLGSPASPAPAPASAAE